MELHAPVADAADPSACPELTPFKDDLANEAALFDLPIPVGLKNLLGCVGSKPRELGVLGLDLQTRTGEQTLVSLKLP